MSIWDKKERTRDNRFRKRSRSVLVVEQEVRGTMDIGGQ